MALPDNEDDAAVAEADATTGPIDATELLRNDHEEVKQLFDDYQSLVDDDAPDEERQELAEQICNALTVHTTIEEEIFYPAAREAIDDADLLDEAEVEHASAKELIEQIQGMQPSDDLYDAKVKVLGEYVKHHVREEEDELFPQVDEADVDLEELGQQMAERKQELMADLGLDED